jgi:hypothetical protein
LRLAKALPRMAGLFAEGADVEADAPLALQRDEAVVQGAHADHRPVQLDDVVFEREAQRQLVEDAALLRAHAPRDVGHQDRDTQHLELMIGARDGARDHLGPLLHAVLRELLGEIGEQRVELRDLHEIITRGADDRLEGGLLLRVEHAVRVGHEERGLHHRLEQRRRGGIEARGDGRFVQDGPGPVRLGRLGQDGAGHARRRPVPRARDAAGDPLQHALVGYGHGLTLD